MGSHKIDTFLELKSTFASSRFDKVIELACQDNGWFTPFMVRKAVESICENMLSREKLTKWLGRYQISNENRGRVGIICAGNIPLVGFYDLLCAGLCNESVSLKPSSKDRVLIEYVAAHLDVDIDIVDSIDRYDIDMLIATGSDTMANSVAQKYSGISSIIRHDRKSVALLTGDESNQQLTGLRDDVFLYFGLGCRNVSHLFLPYGYDFERLKSFLIPYQGDKFAKKAMYERAMAIVTGADFVDAQTFIFLGQDYKEKTPVGVISYSFYDQKPTLDRQTIQCTVGFSGESCNVDFGQTQYPTLDQTADQIDVIRFLNSK